MALRKPKNIIAVIDPAVQTPEIECFNHLVSLSPMPLQYYLAAMGKSLFQASNTEDFTLKGIIVLGSKASVHDQSPWIDQLKASLQKAFDQQIPCLGICFGHQLFAHMSGGKVDYVSHDRKKLSGFRKVELRSSPLSGHQTVSGELTVSHCEMVVQCPKDWEVIASSSEVAIDGMQHKRRPIFSLQPHPEAVPAFYRQTVNPAAAPPPAEKFAFGHDLMRHFLNYCAGEAP